MFVHKNTLLKQLLGAAGGTAVALMMYGAYTVAAPPVKAFIASVLPEQQGGSKFTEGERRERRAEIVDRARVIIERELE